MNKYNITVATYYNNFIIMSEQADTKQKIINSSSLQGRNTNLKNNKISTRANSHSAIRNYSNPRYHQGVDLAKAYSGMVDTHLYQSGFQNHALKSIRRYYDHSKDKQKNTSSKLQNNSQIKPNEYESPQLKRSKSLSNYKSKKIVFSSTSIKPIKVQNNRILLNNPQQAQKLGRKQAQSKSMQIQDPQDKFDKMRAIQLRTVLSRKAQRVPEYSQEVQDVCNLKISLENEIKKLKSLINSEKKDRVKISLNCNKIMNQNQLTYKAYKTRAQENYHLSVACATTHKQIQFLNQEIDNFKQKNLITKENMNNQQAQVLRLKQFVNKTRMILMGQEKDVAKLKTMVSTSYNNMSNNFMNMNLLKSQKALLLSDIDSQHARNK